MGLGSCVRIVGVVIERPHLAGWELNAYRHIAQSLGRWCATDSVKHARMGEFHNI